jgi:hypothetical protein
MIIDSYCGSFPHSLLSTSKSFNEGFDRFITWQALEKLQGKQVAVKMTEIIIEENVACALVELPKGGASVKTMGKPWENGGFNRTKTKKHEDFMGFLADLG